MKLQDFLSDTRVVISVCVLVFLILMVVINFASSSVVDFWNMIRMSVKSKGVKQAAFVYPNPFVFRPYLMWVYLFGGIFAAVFSGRLAFMMKANYSPLDKGHQKGSRRFTTTAELQQEYRSVPDTKKPYQGKGGFPISRYKNRIFIDDSPVNNLIIGTTRSGKGELFVVPAIDIYSRAKGMRDRASLVIADPKGELAGASKEVLERRGYHVLVFDLLHFMGMSYNPLQLVKEAYLKGDKAEAQLLANTLSNIMFYDPQAKDKTWNNWSMALTNALILAVTIDCCREADKCADKKGKESWYGKINMYSVVRMLVDLGEPESDGESSQKNKLDVFFAHRELNDIARIQYASVAAASGKTKGNIYANTLAVLIKFTMDNVAKMTAKNSVNLADVGFNKDHPTAIFLVMPDYDTSNHFLVTMFISQLYYILSKTSSQSPGGKCFREVVFLLDEFGNITPIPDMSNIITVCLGRNIRFDLVVQAYSQIYKLYGERDGQTIIGNCGNQIYLLTMELDTAERYSRLIGNKTITVSSRSAREADTLSLNKSLTERIDTQPLLNPNELMEFTPGENVVVRVTKREDLQHNKIRPNPIYNHNETTMKYRYEYLADVFDTRKSFESLNLADTCIHKNVRLDDIMYTPTVQKEKVYVKSTQTQNVEAQTLYQVLSDRQRETISNFLSNCGISVDWGMTLSMFDFFLQEQLGTGKLSQQMYDDIYNILSPAQERRDEIEIQ
jgi:type IV secretion system protein VirD4